MSELAPIAQNLVAPGRGILAAVFHVRPRRVDQRRDSFRRNTPTERRERHATGRGVSQPELFFSHGWNTDETRIGTGRRLFCRTAPPRTEQWAFPAHPFSHPCPSSVFHPCSIRGSTAWFWLKVTEEALRNVFIQLDCQRVMLDGMLLPGLTCLHRASMDEVADATVQRLLRNVPAAVPGIAFLSGGQSAELASARLNIMKVRFKSRLPWALAFSFARAIQQAALEIWQGKENNVSVAQYALVHRARCNRTARRGEYSASLKTTCVGRIGRLAMPDPEGGEDPMAHPALSIHLLSLASREPRRDRLFPSTLGRKPTANQSKTQRMKRTSC